MHPAQEKAMEFNDGTILGSSPVYVGTEGIDMPTRIVIRDLGDKIVVHAQHFDLSRPPRFPSSFTHGNYFQKTEADALERAWRCFEVRSRKLHGWSAE